MEDSIYRLRHADILTLCVLGLLVLGVVMVQSASMNATGALEVRLQDLKARRSAALRNEKDPVTIAQVNKEYEDSAAKIIQSFDDRPTHWYWTPTGVKQFGFAVVALFTFLGLGYFDYSKLARGALWRNPVIWLLIVGAITCAAVLVPGLGQVKNGAQRWISLGFTQFQPSELGKWSLVIFLAYFISQRKVQLESFFRGFLPTLIPVGIITLLIVIQDFGTAALIGLCTVAILVAGRAKIWHLLVCAAP